jgi:hypothetical protein
MRIPTDADCGAELHQRLVPLAGPDATGRAGSDGVKLFFSFYAKDPNQDTPRVAV